MIKCVRKTKGAYFNLVEYMLCMHKVIGSSPIVSINSKKINIMKSWIKRDLKKRNIIKKLEKKRLVLKSLIKNRKLDIDTIFLLNLYLSNLPRNASPTRIKNRCVHTGRGKGVDKFFKLSRIQIRELGLKGNLTGLKKASW